MVEEERNHKIIMENRACMTVSDVEDVESFDEEKVVIITGMGKVTISGADFRINKLNVDDGQLVIEGEIDELAYSDAVRYDKSGGFFGKLFR